MEDGLIEIGSEEDDVDDEEEDEEEEEDDENDIENETVVKKQKKKSTKNKLNDDVRQFHYFRLNFLINFIFFQQKEKSDAEKELLAIKALENEKELKQAK